MTKKPKPTKDMKQPPQDADKFVWKVGDVHIIPDPRKAKGGKSKKEEN